MLNEQIKIEYVDTYAYVGKAHSGAGISEEKWSITRIEHDAVGKVIGVTHSGGCSDQIYKWVDRLDLEYK